MYYMHMYKHSRKNSAGLSGNFTKLKCLRTFKWNIKTLNETKSSPKNHTTSLPQGVLSADYSNTLGRKIFVDMEFLLYSRLDTCHKNVIWELIIATQPASAKTSQFTCTLHWCIHEYFRQPTFPAQQHNNEADNIQLPLDEVLDHIPLFFYLTLCLRDDLFHPAGRQMLIYVDKLNTSLLGTHVPVEI